MITTKVMPVRDVRQQMSRLLDEAEAVPDQRGEIMREDDDHIMTIEEVAQYLSLHELTVRRLARAGEIPAFKIGRQWRVKRDLLDRWIERKTMRNVGEDDSIWREGPDG